ncbi:MAG: hypothetical protein KDB68_13630 [Planctomycetes bacterium]|nr:hypothetical protein [Planctomycetota bacterium]
MRGLCVIVLALLAGCAATGKGAKPEAETVGIWKGKGLEYETTRGSPLIPEPGSYAADLTLVELDADVAAELLGIEEATDIAPRSFRNAMGEIAAVNALDGHGELLDRPSVELVGGEVSYVFSREHLYLQEWSGETRNSSPLFETVGEGVVCRLRVSEVDGGRCITLESVSSQMSWPIEEFIETPPLQGHAVRVPEVRATERVGTETVRVGETAMFQLGRAGSRLRLLFVRLNVAPK